MKKLPFGIMLLAWVIVVPVPVMAAVDIHFGIPLPPPFVFPAPPEVVVIPDTYAYVVPDAGVDLFFWNGWWWRPWKGRWYRSHYYDRDWAYYDNVPNFYFDVDPVWRKYYRDHNWYGHRWNYERIPYQRLQQNWKSWQDNRRWERRGTWGIQGYRPRSQQQAQELRRVRQEQYYRSPEVQQHQQWKQQQNQVRKPQGQQQKEPQLRQQQHSQPQGQEHQKESQHAQSRGKPQGGDEEHRK